MRRFTLVLAGMALLCAACAPNYKDPDKALLQKAEMLSIALEPPEAAPEGEVKAAYLLADEHGPLDATLQLWLPIGSGTNGSLSDFNADSMSEDLQQMGLDQLSLLNAVLRFHAKPASSYVFDSDGKSTQMLTLYAAPGELAHSLDDILAAPTLLLDEIKAGNVLASVRTLSVAEGNSLNKNPWLTSLNLVDASGEHPIVYGTHLQALDGTLAAQRQRAADQAYEVRAETTVKFKVEAADDGPTSDLRYQWISTGGDFDGRRLRVEPWLAPKYLDPVTFTTDQHDQRGQTGVAFRTDPNLYAVWLVLRDNGTKALLGQTWAEFFVRVIP